MSIPKWGITSLVIAALAVGGTVGALAALVASGDDSGRDRLERSNARLTERLEQAQEATDTAERAAAEAQEQAEQAQAENAALAQQVSDLQTALTEDEAQAGAPQPPVASIRWCK